MRPYLLPLLLFSTDLNVAVSQSDYCSISSQHTLCLYQVVIYFGHILGIKPNIYLQGIGKKCGGQSLKRGVSTKEQEIILNIHNVYRSQIAMGQEGRGRPGPQPPAANMRQMVMSTSIIK